MSNFPEPIKALLPKQIATSRTAVDQLAMATAKATSEALALPFEVTKAQYTRAVQHGLIERSLLQSTHFFQFLNAFEKLSLGPFARQVH